MVTQVSDSAITHDRVIQVLRHIRQEWEDGISGYSLIEVDGSVGFLLYDFARMLGLSPDEMRLALDSLVDEIQEY